MSSSNYRPIFNSDNDFLKYWGKRVGEAKCFKDSVDDIYAGSFVFRSFRNEFEKDNLFDEHSIGLLRLNSFDFDALDKKEPSGKYIPGYKIQSFLPACSELSKKQMSLCFNMYKELCQHKQLEGKNLYVYNEFKETIQKEQQIFLELAESIWSSVNYQRLSQIRPDIANYTTKLWKTRLERLNWYPKHYSKISDIPLIEDSGKQSELSFGGRLKGLGRLPFCFTPLIGSIKLNIFDDVAHNQPDGKSNSKDINYYKEIDYFFQDKNYHPDISKDKIAESLASRTTAKVVMSGSSFLTLLDNDQKCILNTWELPIVVKEIKNGDSQKKVVFIDKAFPPTSLTATERVKWYCKKQMYQLFCHSTSQIHKNSMFGRNFAPDAYTEDITELECFGIDKDESNFGKRPRTRSSCSETEKEFMLPFTPSKEMNASSQEEDFCDSDSENELTIDLGEESPNLASSKHDANNTNEKENSTTKRRRNELSKPFSPFNKTKVVYNQWSLKCDTSNVLLKSNLKDLDIIIRCKEGTLTPRGQVYKMSTKLEYQPEFGAEITTLSELTRDWGNTLIRPNVDLLRVRLDGVTGELIMYEKKSLKDLTIEFNQNHSRNPYEKLVSLHAILGHLTELPPGNYILSHARENGNFAQLYKEEKNKPTYNSNLKYIIINTDSIENPRIGWLPIDKMIITPTYANFGRIPATFHPKAVKCSSKLDPHHMPPEKVKEIQQKILQSNKKKKQRKRKAARMRKNQRKKTAELEEKNKAQLEKTNDALLEYMEEEDFLGFRD